MSTPCVLYAAKSTEDRHGSIPDQLRECRAAVEVLAGRRVLAEYIDEAVSAFSQDRGPGLANAMRHAEELAEEFGTAELWAQHSDRLARGDGRAARHVVEIGLWALKRDIQVRTVQDPDTFRDLLYAVVTGQRNYEDSRRKGLAVSAGHRRAAERGSHMGPRPDGYRVAVDVDAAGGITRRLEFDPDRKQMIELMFRRALQRKSTGSIARALNDAGWRTKPNRRGQRPRTWTRYSVYYVLKNPRYAGLSTYKGTVLGPGKWPAYITPRQHQRIQAWLAKRRQPVRHRSRETYLFGGMARCGFCGGPMQQHTGHLRTDGTVARRYVCAGQYGDRCAERCQAPRIDADVAEGAFVAAFPALFDREEPMAPAPAEEAAPRRRASPTERQQLIDAARSGDDSAIDDALERLLARAPEIVLANEITAVDRRARQQQVIAEFQEWAKTGIGDRSDDGRREAVRLNAVLRRLVTRVDLKLDARDLSVVIHQRPTDTLPARQVVARLPRGMWREYSSLAERTQPHIFWSRESIAGALRRWAEIHGHTPRASAWELGGFEHPNAATVRAHFGRWEIALRAAGLPAANQRAVRHWRDEEIIHALQTWTKRHGRVPTSTEWIAGTRYRPCRSTVYNRFGTWTRALAVAGLRG